MESTAPAYQRAMSGLWEGFVTTFLAWSPPPEPVVTWDQTPKHITRLGRWIRSETFSWLLVIATFGIGVAAGQDNGGVASLVVGVIAAVPVLLGHYNLLVGWRAALLASVLAAVWGAFFPLEGIVAMVVVGLSGYTFLIGATYRRPVGLWAWVVTVPIVTVVWGGAISAIAIFGALLALVADGLRARRLGTQQLTDERERAGVERARRVSVEERSRIARDLHDVVAHHMSMVAVRAETAPYRVTDLSDEAKAEFAEISSAARESLNEIRGVLTLLRDDETPRMPQPDLDQIDDLVENARRAGANVELRVSGRRRPVRAAVELSAYRILQESLANVTRHAPGETAEVWVDYGEESLSILVANPQPAPAASPGHGITGMRERAVAVGGKLDARSRPDGRFVVEASLPLKA